MEEEFEEAQYQLGADASLVQGATDAQRRSLYGLNKQAKMGNCNMELPDSKDFKTMWKYEAWKKFEGMTQEDAMSTFVLEMRKLIEQNGDIKKDINNRPSSPSNASVRSSTDRGSLRAYNENSLSSEPPDFRNSNARGSDVSITPIMDRTSINQKNASPDTDANTKMNGISNSSPTDISMKNDGMNHDSSKTTARESDSSLRDTNDSATSNRPNKPSKPIHSKRQSISTYQKEGILFKQQDVFKGWMPRYFVLSGSFLHYYMKSDDATPKKSMEISGCKVTNVKQIKVGGKKIYYSFCISHASAPDTYHLAGESEMETIGWITDLRMAASKYEDSSNTGADESEGPTATPAKLRRMLGSVTYTKSPFKNISANPANTVEYEKTKDGIPADILPKVEMAVKTMLLATSDTEVPSPGKDNSPSSAAASASTFHWKQQYFKRGVTGYKSESGASVQSSVCVKGYILLDYPMLEIFGTLMNQETIREFNPQIDHVKTKLKFGTCSFVENVKCFRIWPTATRDYMNFVHWRLLEDGRIVIAAFSDKSYSDQFPPEHGTVRAEMILGGYLLTRVNNKTRVDMVLQSDLHGNIPRRISNMVATQQPMILANIQSIIENNRAHCRKLGLPPPLTGQKDVNFEDLVYAFKNPDEFSRSSLEPESKTIAKMEQNNAAKKRMSTSQKIESAVKSQVTNLTKQKKYDKLNLWSGLTIFTPVLAYYVSPNEYRTVGFLVGLIFTLRYLLNKMVGAPKVRTDHFTNAGINHGSLRVKLPVPLPKLLKYVDDKRTETEMDVNMSLVVAKAVAMALHDTPELNGHTMYDGFYPTETTSVDISVSVELADRSMLMHKVLDADKKTVDYIADEVSKLKEQESTKVFTQTAEVPDIMEAVSKIFPKFYTSVLERLTRFIGERLGLSVAWLGVKPFPLGVCCILSLPARKGETDVESCFTPDFSLTSTPIFVTMGGVSMKAETDDSQIKLAPVTNVNVIMNSRVGPLSLQRSFCSRLQQYLNNPNLIEKAHRQVSRRLSKIVA